MCIHQETLTINKNTCFPLIFHSNSLLSVRQWLSEQHMDCSELMVGGEQAESIQQLGVCLYHARLGGVQVLQHSQEQNFGLKIIFKHKKNSKKRRE